MTNQYHILIIDDDSRILKLLKDFLAQNNFLASTANDVPEAEELLKDFAFDLIILDVMLPGVTGLEFARNIKLNGNTTPILMLTALSEPDDRVRGLESGANDYISKPFDPRELLLRIKNLIDAHQKDRFDEQLHCFGNNIYNFRSKEFTKSGNSVKLTSREQKILEILINQKGQPISREELMQKMHRFLSLRSVDVQIVRIRNKIEDNPKEPRHLKTVRNEGYVLYT